MENWKMIAICIGVGIFLGLAIASGWFYRANQVANLMDIVDEQNQIIQAKQSILNQTNVLLNDGFRTGSLSPEVFTELGYQITIPRQR